MIAYRQQATVKALPGIMHPDSTGALVYRTCQSPGKGQVAQDKAR